MAHFLTRSSPRSSKQCVYARILEKRTGYVRWRSPHTCRAHWFLGGVVPLSEHEQRQLEQIEQALYREDPKFGRLVRLSDPRVHYKRKLAQGLVGVLAGA